VVKDEYVGNGNSISVWKSSWLRLLENSFITSPCAHYLENTVRELLDVSERCSMKGNMLKFAKQHH